MPSFLLYLFPEIMWSHAQKSSDIYAKTLTYIFFKGLEIVEGLKSSSIILKFCANGMMILVEQDLIENIHSRFQN